MNLKIRKLKAKTDRKSPDLNRNQNLSQSQNQNVSQSQKKGQQKSWIKKQKTNQRIEAAFHKKLQSLRDKIDSADRSMIQALARRSAIVEKIGLLKKNHGEPLRQKSRWNQLRRERAKFATGLGVDRQLILAIFECIQKESISRQSRAKSKGPKK